MQNVLQPVGVNGTQNNDPQFATNICNALMQTTNPDNNARAEAENYMK